MLISFVIVALAAQPLPRVSPVVDMARRVAAITGSSPRECGRHPAREVGGRVERATRDQLRASLECARVAIKSGQPFWTFVEAHGIDSWVAHGLLRTASGDLRFFEYDSDPCGGIRCEPDLSLYPCAEPVVTADAGGEDADFSCRDR